MSHRIGLFLMIFQFVGYILTAQNPFIRHYTTADGLPSNTVYHILQDSKQFIWFATDAGVARFDGSRFDYWTKKDGLNSNEVVRIQEDSRGRIWFFNLNGTINFYKQGKIFNEQNAPYLDSLKSKEFFRKFYEAGDKILYFYYNDGGDIVALDILNGIRRFSFSPLMIYDTLRKDSLDWMVIRHMTQDGSGEFSFWMQPGIATCRDLSVAPKITHQGFTIRDVFPARGDTLYIWGTWDLSLKWVLFRCCGKRILDTIPSPLHTTSFYKLVSSILEDKSGHLWMSTFNEGILCLRDKRVVFRIPIREGQSMMQDHEKNLWVGSMCDGVLKINPDIAEVIHYDRKNTGSNGVTAFWEDPGTGLWFADGKRISLLKDGIIFTMDYMHPNGEINRLRMLQNHTLLVWQKGMSVTEIRGVYLDYKKRRVHYSNTFTPFLQSFIKEIVSNRSGNEFASFSSIAYRRFSSGSVFDQSKWKFANSRVYNVFYDLKDELVINADRNYVVRNDERILSPKWSFFNGSIITGHLILNDSMELVNIEGENLFLVSGDKRMNLSASWTLFPGARFKNLVFKDSVLCFSTGTRIYCCTDPEVVLEGKPVHLHSVELTFSSINDLALGDGYLNVASETGLTRIPVGFLLQPDDHKPSPYIHSINVNGVECPDPEEPPQARGNSRIRFNFSSKSYSSQDVVYAYQLSGSDTAWIPAFGRDVTYKNLSPGRYNFMVRSRHMDTGWSDPVELPLTIHATLWQHPLFFVGLSILAAILIALGIVRQKNQQLKRQEMNHQLITLEQKALQSMMNPHFIFNALSSIQSYLLQNRPGEAGLYLSQFARLIRQNLGAINVSMIPVEEELDRLKNYLDLERFRMSERFNYTIELDESTADEEIRIPSMIIQPFVENAILHGISGLNGQGLVRILVSMRNETSVEIIIEDNGIGIRNAGAISDGGDKHLNMGMGITRKRLEIIGLKMRVKTSLVISEAYPGSPHPGTRVTLVVPVDFGKGDR